VNGAALNIAVSPDDNSSLWTATVARQQIKHLSSGLARVLSGGHSAESRSAGFLAYFGREMQHEHMPDSSLHVRSGESFRQLRAITILTFPLGVGLMVPYFVITGLIFPTVGLAPMLFSTVLGSLMYTNALRSPSKKAIIDIALTVVYLTLLMPR
jgi:hypothetical protein